MSARSDIALLDARANELLEKLNSLESKQSWIKLQDAYTKLRKTKNQEEAGFLLEEIGKLITEGNREREVWDEIRECISSKLKSKTYEIERMKTLGAFITIAQANTFVQALIAGVNENVRDEDVRRKIANSLLKIINEYLGQSGDIPLAQKFSGNLVDE